MSATEALEETQKHLEEIERKLEALTRELEYRQKQLRKDSALPRTLSVEEEPDVGPHLPGLG